MTDIPFTMPADFGPHQGYAGAFTRAQSPLAKISNGVLVLKQNSEPDDAGDRPRQHRPSRDRRYVFRRMA